MKYAIVTPTFKEHFSFIKVYLESFNRYVRDKNNIIIYFTINTDEKKEFYKIISKFKNLNIKVLLFDEILRKNHIA